MVARNLLRLVLIGCALVAVTAGTAAGAAGRPTPAAGHLGIVHPHGAARGAKTPAGTAVVNDLIDHGGTVMHKTTIYAMYWIPAGYAVDNNFQSLIDGYLTNVASDSGTTSNVYGDTPQYGVPYDSTFGGAAVDHTPFPLGSCGPNCLSETQIASELISFAAAQGWPADAGSAPTAPQRVFAVFLPRNVVSCFDDLSTCSDNYYCAYHTATTTGDGQHTFIWLNMPYDWAAGFGCGNGVTPNNDVEADAAIDVLSHEYIEAATDPFGTAWYDANGEEIADKCQTAYGSSLGNSANQLIGTGHYETQLEYSNALHGCYQVGAPTLGSFSPSTGIAGDSVGITGTNFFGAVAVSFHGTAATNVTVDSPTHVTAVVPAGASAGPITVYALGGQVTSAADFGLPATLTSFSPVSGVAGTAVTIRGTGLGSATEVDFNGVPASIGNIAANGTSLVAFVPGTTSPGPISVVVGGSTLASTGSFAPLPKITGFSGEPALVGDFVTVNGTNLAGLTGATLGGVALSTGSAGVSSFTVTLPDGVVTGKLVETTTAGTATSSAALHVLPTIASFPSHAVAGAKLAVAGATFSGTSSVTVGGAKTSFKVVDSHTLSVTIPAAAASGPIAVTNAGGTSVSSTAFTLDPSIGKTDKKSAAGSTLTISGSGLSGATLVDFAGGVSAAPASASASLVTVTVPVNAQTGPVTVHVPAGAATSARAVAITFSIQAISPTTASYGADVVITGTGLKKAVKAVTFNGVAGTITSRSNSTLHVRVPASGALSGPIVILTSNLQLTWPQPFSLAP